MKAIRLIKTCSDGNLNLVQSKLLENMKGNVNGGKIKLHKIKWSKLNTSPLLQLLWDLKDVKFHPLVASATFTKLVWLGLYENLCVGHVIQLMATSMTNPILVSLNVNCSLFSIFHMNCFVSSRMNLIWSSTCNTDKIPT